MAHTIPLLDQMLVPCPLYAEAAEYLQGGVNCVRQLAKKNFVNTKIFHVICMRLQESVSSL